MEENKSKRLKFWNSVKSVFQKKSVDLSTKKSEKKTNSRKQILEILWKCSHRAEVKNHIFFKLHMAISHQTR